MGKYNQREKKIIKKLVEYKSDFDNFKTLGRFFSEKIFPKDIHLITDGTGTNNLVYCKKEDKRENQSEKQGNDILPFGADGQQV